MRIKLNSNEFVDFIVLFLLERITKENGIEYSEEAQDFFDTLQRKGMKSYLLKYFFGTDAELRNKYKFVNDIFNESEETKTHELLLSQDIEVQESTDVYKEIIERTAQLVSGKTNLDEEKLHYLQETVINEITNNDSNIIEEE
jgi:hypothetical protein